MTGSKYLKVFVDGGEIVSRILSSLFPFVRFDNDPSVNYGISAKRFSFFFCKLISTPFLDQLLRIRYQLVDYAKFENIL